MSKMLKMAILKIEYADADIEILRKIRDNS